MSAWVLPDHLADVLPSEARHIEELRRKLLDKARCYGYELVMPPLLEHLESLLTGAGQALDLQTFKLVDQLSGRMMGLRADSTPQVARIDAHLLNRKGVTRLCYCGPVLHTRPGSPRATREPLQFGAEIYGHSGPEADLEVLLLALDGLQAAGLTDVQLDLADARIVRALIPEQAQSPDHLGLVHAALVSKDDGALRELTRTWPAAQRNGILALIHLYGDQRVLREAEQALPQQPEVAAALGNLRWLYARLPQVRVGFDLADLRGYAYYSGATFAAYAQGAADAVVRGGRYDHVGAVFGRNRPAAGFSLDLKTLVGVLQPGAPRLAVRAPWGDDPVLREVIASLRSQGETVVCVLPGHESEVDEFQCDRELTEIAGRWVVQAVDAGKACEA
ncbi:MAG: ATP phosphoribosyltransferase regulatory subunit [Rhodoferax sp.]|nr:ATP phosphoribosyltransferase regulatory subunit [Rhodoferax sp.]